MEGPKNYGDGHFENAGEVEEEFRSCCEDEEWQDTEECLAEFSSSEEEDIDDDDDEVSSNEEDDEFSLRMFFKGVSLSENGGLGSKASGIGVVMETSAGDSILQVQKKLDFYVMDLVAEHLALLDGLIEAQRNGVQRIVGFTDSEAVYHQVNNLGFNEVFVYHNGLSGYMTFALRIFISFISKLCLGHVLVL